MEKFSAYRDPGTGIQPFLTPVPPLGSDLQAKVILPLRLLLGAVRTVLVIVLIVFYTLVSGVCAIFAPVPPFYRIVSHFFTAVIGRAVLLTLGLFYISAEQVRRKRGRGQSIVEPWNPGAGDVIVSNWVSWIEILWLAIRFNPIFVLPVLKVGPRSMASLKSQASATHALGPVEILGFQTVSLLTIVGLTGQVPPFGYVNGRNSKPPLSLENLRKSADRPIVVFPECTTSNGRGLLRFAKVFRQEVPAKGYQVFVMCVRYDPPTSMTPTPTLSIPSPSFNPLPHLFSLASSIIPPTISIRLLAPSESPSSPLFIVSEIITDLTPHDDQLTEVSAELISQLGRIKRTAMGWEDKARFLDFYRGKHRR